MKKVFSIFLIVILIIISFTITPITALNNNPPIINIQEPEKDIKDKIKENKIKHINSAVGIILKHDFDISSLSVNNDINSMSYEEYNTLKIDYAKEYFYNLRDSFLNKYPKLMRKYDLDVEVSSPYIFIYTTKQINNLSDLVNLSPDFKEIITDNSVERIFEVSFYETGVIGPPPESLMDPGGGASDITTPYSDAFDAINVSNLIALDHDGTNIKIGFLESDGVLNQYDSQFSNRNVTIKDNVINPGNPSYSSHATSVAAIAAGNDGIARDADIYAAEYESLEGNLKRFPENELNWFSENGVNILNISFGIDFTIHEEIDAFEYINYFESVMSLYNIIIVSGTGNLEDPTELDAVMYPAMIPSVICVGGTNASGNDIYSNAEYNSAPNYGHIQKPDIVAPADIDDGSTSGLSGTSFATPLVSGAIALLLENNPDLLGSTLVPDTIGAIHALLAASANQDCFDQNLYFLNNYGYDNKLGSGLLDVEKLLELGGTSFSNAKLLHLSISFAKSSSIFNEIITVNPGTSELKLALWWNYKSDLSFLGENTLLLYNCSDYYIMILDGNQTIVANSPFNHEILKYDITVTSSVNFLVYQNIYYQEDDQGPYYADLVWLSWSMY